MNIYEQILKWYQDKSLPKTCKYALSEIGCADENHVKSRKWKTHLKEKSQQRLNITNMCDINHKEYETLHEFLENNMELIDFVSKHSLKLCVYSQHWWRRGTDVSLYDISVSNGKIFYSDFIRSYDSPSADYVSLFVLNLEIIDDGKEDWVEDRFGSESD